MSRLGYVIKTEYGERRYTTSYKEAQTIQSDFKKNGIGSIIVNLDRPQHFGRGGGQAIGSARDISHMKKGGGSWSTGELAGIVHGGHSEAADYTYRTNVLPKRMKKAAQRRLREDIRKGVRPMIKGFPVETALQKKIHLRTRHGKRQSR